MINCSIVGATGYTGIELTRILLRHPRVHLAHLTSRRKAPPRLEALIPEVSKSSSLEIETFDQKRVVKGSDVVFVCLPHTESCRLVERLIKAGKIVIDLGADFRLNDVRAYQQWYDWKHPLKDLLSQAAYGLPEVFREQISKADLIANPGCYPTSALLGIAPLLADGLIQEDAIAIDSKSGTSGAGKKLTDATFFGEVNENFKAYKVGKHQHTPEIQMVMDAISEIKAHFSFVTHLLPLERGILTTLHLRKKKGVRKASIRKAFEQIYEQEPFVRVLKEGDFPSLKSVQKTNYCDIGVSVEDRSDSVVVISAIDNLLKGASGQAVQNMNIRLGFPEDMGF